MQILHLECLMWWWLRVIRFLCGELYFGLLICEWRIRIWIKCIYLNVFQKSAVDANLYVTSSFDHNTIIQWTEYCLLSLQFIGFVRNQYYPEHRSWADPTTGRRKSSIAIYVRRVLSSVDQNHKTHKSVLWLKSKSEKGSSRPNRALVCFNW